MKRPLVVIGFTCLFVNLVSIFLGLAVSIILSLITIILLCLLVNITKNLVSIIIIFSTILFSLTAFYFNFKFNILPIYNLKDKDLTITATLCELPYVQNNKYNYVFEVKTVENIENFKKFRIALTSQKALEMDVFDEVTCKIHTFLPESDVGFFSIQHLASKKIHLKAFLYDYEEIKIKSQNNSKPFYYHILHLRKKLISSTHRIFQPQTALLANAIILGEKHDFPDEIRRNFETLGIQHLLTISGIHVSVLIWLFSNLLKKTRLNSKISYILTVIAVLAFMAVTGFAFSVLRAGIMAIICLLGQVLSKKSDALNSLGIAVFIVILHNPYAACDISLLLSTFSTLSIIVFSPKINEYIMARLKTKNIVIIHIINSISATFSVSIFTVPLTIWIFKQISILSVLSNLLFIPLVSLIFCVLLPANILFTLGVTKSVLSPLLLISKILSDLVIKLANMLSTLPFSLVSIDYPFVKLWISLCLILFSVAIIFGIIKKMYKILSLISINLLLLAIFSFQTLMHNKVRVEILNVFDGNAIVLSYNGRVALICCGGEKFNSKMIANCVNSTKFNTVDLLFLPAIHENHNNFIKELEFLCNPLILMLPIDNKIPGNYNYYSENVEIDLWENIRIKAKKIENKIWVELKISDNSILMCPQGGDCRNLPEEWHFSDFIVGKLPIDFEFIKPNNVILCMNEGTDEINISKVNQHEINVFSIAKQGEIVIDFSKTNKFEIKKRL